mmetsp:Transcript_24282/g.58180  ORF Transcript_24282/g.58180 Transcript_24282/m.58180 type:complete len:223 (+) Transcript_24282:3410-4078(+)
MSVTSLRFQTLNLQFCIGHCSINMGMYSTNPVPSPLLNTKLRAPFSSGSGTKAKAGTGSPSGSFDLTAMRLRVLMKSFALFITRSTISSSRTLGFKSFKSMSRKICATLCFCLSLVVKRSSSSTFVTLILSSEIPENVANVCTTMLTRVTLNFLTNPRKVFQSKQCVCWQSWPLHGLTILFLDIGQINDTSLPTVTTSSPSPAAVTLPAPLLFAFAASSSTL